MDNKEKFDFDFDFNDTYEDIMKELKQKNDDDFEDIVSDTSLKNAQDTVDIYSVSSGKQKAEKSGGKTNVKRKKNWWQRLSKVKKGLIISVTALVLVLSILLGWIFSTFDYNYNPITTDPEELGFETVINKKVINIALFGVDTRNETKFTGNTDSIMVLSLNTVTKKVKIFSIMRDSFVPMEYEGRSYYGKINSAYSKSPEHAIKTINKNFNLDISEYATVNFVGMTNIIDAVGGITATITEDELRDKGRTHPNLNGCMVEICSEMGLNPSDYYVKSAGEQTLNGVQAVAYARVRSCTSVWNTRDDYGRTDRQRHVMQELFRKAIKMKKSQYVDLIKALIPCTETSLSYSDILSLAVNMLLNSPSFEQYRIPQNNFVMRFRGPSRYGSVVYYDLQYTSRLINAIIYDDVTLEQFVEANPIEKNDWFNQ